MKRLRKLLSVSYGALNPNGTDAPETGKRHASATEWYDCLITMFIFLVCFVAFTMLICGCHFHPAAVIPTLVPVAWSVILLVTYQTKSGRFGAWLAFLLALVWLWLGYDANLKFIFG